MNDLDTKMLFEGITSELQALRERVELLESRPPKTLALPALPSEVPARDPEADRQAAAEVARQQAELQRITDEIERARVLMAKARADSDTARARHAEAARMAAEESAAWESQRAALREQAAALDQTRRVIVKIWPGFLLGDAFTYWKERLETALLREQTPAAPALLFANLHGYTACLLESDLKYLRDVLRDISRFLYAWLKEEGHSEHDACTVAQEWAAAFNAECAGRCEIDVPEPGTPANNQWMTFPPRGGAPDVVTVKTWCVKDAARRVIHRAEVFTS